MFLCEELIPHKVQALSDGYLGSHLLSVGYTPKIEHSGLQIVEGFPCMSGTVAVLCTSSLSTSSSCCRGFILGLHRRAEPDVGTDEASVLPITLCDYHRIVTVPRGLRATRHLMQRATRTGPYEPNQLKARKPICEQSCTGLRSGTNQASINLSHVVLQRSLTIDRVLNPPSYNGYRRCPACVQISGLSSSSSGGGTLGSRNIRFVPALMAHVSRYAGCCQPKVTPL